VVLRDVATIKSDIQQLLLRNDAEQSPAENLNTGPDPMLKLPIDTQAELDGLNEWLTSDENFIILVSKKYLNKIDKNLHN